MEGTIPLLTQILQQDYPLISSSSMLETPLHISCLLGRVEITKGFLTQNPELVKSLNSNGSTPLHLAAAKGYVQIVKDLVSVNPDMCFVLDHDGRGPLHLAAIKGRVEVLIELIRVKPEAARVLTGGGKGESCLHLCVKYNRFDALKVLVERLKKENDDQFVNWKDSDGNTVLHLAVAKKQIEIVKYLLSKTEIDIHARNVNGFTALDVLLQSQEDLRNMDIRQCLEHGRASNVTQTPLLVPVTNVAARTTTSTGRAQNLSNVSLKKQPVKRKQTDWLAKMRSALMVVASLVATVAFQAGLSPPGGVWASDEIVDSNGNPLEKRHFAGQSVMAINLPQAYGQFLIFNTISFLASLSIILLQVSGLPLRRHRWMWTQLVIMWIAITAQSITYYISFVNLSPGRLKEGVLSHVTWISVLVWLCLMGVVFIGNVIRAVHHVLGKKGYMMEKEREPTIFAEVEENDEL